MSFFVPFTRKIVIANWKNVERFRRISELCWRLLDENAIIIFIFSFSNYRLQKKYSDKVWWWDESKNAMGLITFLVLKFNFSMLERVGRRVRLKLLGFCNWMESPALPWDTVGTKMEFLFRKKLSITKKVLQELPHPDVKKGWNIWLFRL